MNISRIFSLLAVVFLIGLLIYFFANKFIVQAAPISGKVVFTGLKPDPGDKGSLIIKYKEYKDAGDYKSTNVVLGLQNNAPFSWKDAKDGEIYEVIAELQIDGKNIKQSEPITITAPAQNQTLPIRVTWRDLPKDVVESQDADIKGDLILNGYIPQGSTLVVLAKEQSQADFQIVQSFDQPKPLKQWSWTKSLPLKDYRIKAELRSSTDEVVGHSDEISAVGGDSEINLVINSTAKHANDSGAAVSPTPNSKTPQPTKAPAIERGKISGTIYINGPKDKDSSLLLLWRTPGQKEYQVIKRIDRPIHGGQSWEWTIPIVGKQYEITTALQVNNNNTATSNSKIVVAPAQSVDFTLNTGVVVDTPSGQPTVEACNKVNDTEYDVTIKWPRLEKAGNYWFQIGENPTWNNIRNEKRSADSNSDNKRTTNRIQKERNYYAQYAYSYCTNCSGDLNFSNFSQPFKFSCSNDPAPTATPTLPPNTSACNQTCGSNGYSCVTGLQCVSGSTPGSQVCRNPNCTDKSDCRCQ